MMQAKPPHRDVVLEAIESAPMNVAKYLFVLLVACGGTQSTNNDVVCTTGEVICNGACTTTATDSLNCGTCGIACASGDTCTDGTCKESCSHGASLCGPVADGGSYCTDLSSDNDNCGSCGNACHAGFSCGVGVCARTCAAPETACGDTCVDTMNDRENCGACGNQCWAECKSGTCAKAISIATGGYSSCLATELGTVWCWGAPGPSLATQVQGITTAEAVVAGADFACAQTLEGAQHATLCWGAIKWLGTGLTQSSSAFPTPTNLGGPVGHLVGGGAYDIGNGGRLCEFDLMWNGVFCAGTNSEGAIGDGTVLTQPMATQSKLNANMLATGESHTCSIWFGATTCVGSNERGQLGDGATFGGYSTTPVSVALTPQASYLALGSAHTCAALSDQTIACWGDNTSGQLGNNTTVQSTSPVPVTGFTDFTNFAPGQTGIVAGKAHTCAIHKNGDVGCWGSNVHGQLGDGTATDALTPTKVVGLPQAAFRLASGANHVCAVLYATGAVMCWGDNSMGQLGNGTTIASPNPVAVR